MFRKFTTNLVVAALLTSISGVQAADGGDGVVAGLEWASDAATVERVLKGVCKSVDVANASLVQFPLAADTEQHFRCENMALPGGRIEAAVFVVADDRLKLAELRGGAANALLAPDEEPQMRYLRYDVYKQASLFIDAEADAAWLLSAEALHPNLFAWSHPFLEDAGAKLPEYDASAALPSLIQPGGDLKALTPQFEARCPLMNVEPIMRPWLETGPKTQTQVNCFGYVYAGFPRKFEAVFGDGELELVWILTGKPEESRVRKALVDEFGESESVTENWDVFSGGQVALRKDKPEILVISKKLVPYYRDQFRSE